MKSILVATDLSAGSERALRRAVVLAAQTSSRVTCLHVIDEKLTGAAAEAHRAEAEATIKTQIGGADDLVTVRIMSGNRFDAILAAAQEESSDLVVIGRHRSVTELDLFRGSTAERVLKTGNRPVLMVKQAVTGPYQRLMIATDFSASARSAVEFALATFTVPKVELTLVHAYPPRAGAASAADQHFTEFLAGLEDALPSIRKLTLEGGPVPTLMKSIERLTPDLVIVGTHGRTGTEPLQIGTVAEQILSQSAVDVLAVRG
jgi:universal stress protein E